MSLEDEKQEPEVFREHLDDDPSSSFRLSLELDLDLRRLLSFDRGCPLSLEVRSDCDNCEWSFLLSRDLDRDFELDRPRFRSLTLDVDLDLDLERDFDHDFERDRPLTKHFDYGCQNNMMPFTC